MIVLNRSSPRQRKEKPVESAAGFCLRCTLLLIDSRGHDRRAVCARLKRAWEMAQKKTPRLLGGSPINPQPVRGDMTAADLIDNAFLAYNGRRLKEACRLFAEKMLA